MNIRRFQFNSGESYSILLGGDLSPMCYPNLFVTLYHRNRSDSANTCYKELEHIKIFYKIINILDINIEDRFRNGLFLERNEIERIVGLAKYRNDILNDKKITYFTSNSEKKKLTLNKKENVRFLSDLNRKNFVSSKTCYNRLTTFSNYIEWLESVFFH